MPNKRSPRHGSKQYWPRSRARRIYPRCRNWPTSKEAKPLGFAAYKVEMGHAIVTDNRPNALTKGEPLFVPVTLLECPPLRIFSVRFYKNTPNGSRVAKEILVSNEKRLSRKLPVPEKLSTPNLDGINPGEFEAIRMVCYTQPQLTSRGQKVPELFEVALGGKPEEQLEFIKAHIGKDILISEVFSEGEQVDVGAVTKGKGFQGTVKRFGVAIRSHKSEKTKRGIGSLGPWHPRRVLSTVPQTGKTGFYTRMEFNKQILKIGKDNLNPKGGFRHYGTIKNEYILLKGSIPGPAKRIVRLYKAKRPNRKYPAEAPVIESLVIQK